MAENPSSCLVQESKLKHCSPKGPRFRTGTLQPPVYMVGILHYKELAQQKWLYLAHLR